MDLKDKLDLLGPSLGLGEKKKSKRPIPDLSKIIKGETVENKFGQFFRTQETHPFSEPHGEVDLNGLFEIPSDIFGLIGKSDSLKNINPKRTLFIDTETTGLAGGAGTVPFMIGIGFFEDNGFSVQQYFMRDFNEERAVLDSVYSLLDEAESFVSYNGKCYDFNLLSSRFTLSRMGDPVQNKPHLDLLFSARRIWKRRLGDCSLSNIESNILRFKREGDVPGWQIPSLYFEYLRSGNPAPLEPVFHHNFWDIVSLAALMTTLGQVYTKPKIHISESQDMVSLGRAMDALSRFDQAASYYRAALDLEPTSEDKEDALHLLGFALKRNGDWDKAIQIWRHLIQHFSFQVSPYEELAKYYEHKVDDPEQAIPFAKKAIERIELLEELHLHANYQIDRHDLEYRLARLERKQSVRLNNK
ncbi:ribonuclease H-like domain-containing protein [candidate division KSB1 bacterium]|nr:ribonuclease H-like domain-containing protein [candidate division KSB1 bacterium]